MAGKMLRFSALALLGGAAANYVEYSTYMNDDCATVLSTTVYTGVPSTEGVYTVDTCFAFEEGVTTFYDSAAANTEAGTLSVQYVCNITSGELVPTWYSDDECGEADGFVTLEVAVDTCTATCTEDEPDFGSDEFDEATITFYEDEDCATEVESEVYSGADLYALYGIDGTSCTMSGDYDFYTVLHCSESSPAAVYYEDAQCAGDMVGIAMNAACAPVPTAANGTYPGDYFMAECTEGVVEDEDDDTVEEEEEEEEEEVDDESTSGATSSSLVFGGLSGGIAAVVVAATSVAAFF